jgi:endonuclease/exonuclease/phosphatase family metal-dependent hydrolase
VLVAHVQLDGGTGSLVCGYPVAVPEQARRAQVRALLGRRDESLILGADLNETPAALATEIAAAGFRDALQQDPTPTRPMRRVTFGAAWERQLERAPHFSLEPRRLDYLLSRGAVALSAGVEDLHDGDRYASDHALVWARFRPGR